MLLSTLFIFVAISSSAFPFHGSLFLTLKYCQTRCFSVFVTWSNSHRHSPEHVLLCSAQSVTKLQANHCLVELLKLVCFEQFNETFKSHLALALYIKVALLSNIIRRVVSVCRFFLLYFSKIKVS